MGNKWPGIQDQINASGKHVKVLPADMAKRQAIRDKGEISRSSMLGTVLNNCGGIVVENWIRIYGAGELDFEARNALWGQEHMLIAEDPLGGLFGGMEDGTVGYFAPATLVWEPLHLSYPQFLAWSLSKNTKMFYELQRWKGWEKDAAALRLDQGYCFEPQLWRLGSATSERERKIVPVQDLIQMLLDTAQQRKEKYGK